MTVKTCLDCGVPYQLEDFYRDRSKPDGRMIYCKNCAYNRSMGRAAKIREARSPRLCVVCEQPTWKSMSRYCVKHRDEALVRRVTRRRRGNMTPLQLAKAKERERKRQRAWSPEKSARYGIHHQRTKASWRPIVATGTVRCPTCGQLIRADEPWDLGHVPGGGPNDYLGPQHARCNRATAKKGIAKGRESRPRQIFVAKVL